MEEVAETSPKPEGQGAASAALLHLVPQRKFALPPVADDRSMATLPRSRPVGSPSPDPASPLSAGSQRRHRELLPANRKYRSWIDQGQRALAGSGKLPRRTEMRDCSPRPGQTRKEDGPGRARKRSYRSMTRAPPGSTRSRPDGHRSCESQASPTPDDSGLPARRPDTGPDGDFLGGRRSSWDRPELVESARHITTWSSRRGRARWKPTFRAQTDSPTTVELASLSLPAPAGTRKGGGHRAVNTGGDAVVTLNGNVSCPLTAARAFIPLHTKPQGKGEMVSFLYDSGAQASILLESDFLRLRDDGARWEDAGSIPCALTAANGAELKFSLVARVTLFYQDREFRIPFFVCPGAARSILGLNAIQEYNLRMHKIIDTASGKPRIRIHELSQQKPGFAYPKFQARAVRGLKMHPRTGISLAHFELTDESGRLVTNQREILVDYVHSVAVVNTDGKGRFRAPISNMTYQRRHVKKGEIVARVHEFSAEFADKAQLFGKLDAAQSAVQRKLSPTQVKEIQRKLERAVGTGIPRKDRRDVLNLLFQHVDVFSAGKDDVGYCPLTQQTIRLKDDHPIFRPQHQVPAEHLAAIKEQTLAWMNAGIVKKIHSPYNSPIFVMPDGKDAGIRVAMDFRHLNESTTPRTYDIPTIDESLRKVQDAGAKWFSKLTLYAGFFHIPLEEKSQRLTAYTIPGHGQWAWCRAAEGLLGSPSSLNQVMDSLLGDLDGCVSHVEEALCFGQNLPDHLKSLTRTLARIHRAGFRLDPEKSTFLVDRVDFLGAELSTLGIRPRLDRVEAIRKEEPPRTCQQLRLALELFDHLSKFIFNYHAKVAPLRRDYQARRLKHETQLSEEAESAFRQLQAEITSRPILKLLDKSMPLHLYVDAALGDQRKNGMGFGAALLQDGPNDIKRPVAYISRGLTQVEKNYPAGLAELKAIMWALETLGPELKHRQFFLYSDHKPLTDKMIRGLNDKSFANCSTFTKDLYPIWRHVPGTANVLADFLSRYHGIAQETGKQDAATEDRIAESSAIVTNWASNPAALDMSLPRLQYLSRLDPLIREVMTNIAEEVKHSTVDHEVMAQSPRVPLPVTIWKGVLLVRTMDRRFRIYCPSAMRREVLVTAHEGQVAFGGHLGTGDTISNAAKQMWWPNQEDHCRRFVEGCDICKDRNSNTPASTPPPVTPRRPHEQVEIWVEGPVARGHGKLSYILVYIDVLTKHLLLRAVNGNEPDEIAEAVYQITQVFGIPRRIVAPHKTTIDFETALRRLLLKSRYRTEEMKPSLQFITNSGNQTTHERVQDLLERSIQLFRDSALPLHAVLLALQKEYNNSICPESRLTPFEAKFGHTAHNPLWETYESVFRQRKENRLGVAGQYLRAQMEMRQLFRDGGRLGSPRAQTQEIPYQERSPVVVIDAPHSREDHGFVIRKLDADSFLIYVPAGQGRQGKRVTVRRECLKPAPMGLRWMAQPAWKRERAAYFGMRVLSQPESQDEAAETRNTEEFSDHDSPSEASSTDDEVTLSQRTGVNAVSRTTQPANRLSHPYLRPLLERQVVVSRPRGRKLYGNQVHQVKRYLEAGGATILDVPRQRDPHSVTITVASAGTVARICETRMRRVRGKKMSFRQLRDQLGAKGLPLQEIERIALKLQTTPEGRNQLADMINEGLIPLTSEPATLTTRNPEDESGAHEARMVAQGNDARGSGTGNETTTPEQGAQPRDPADESKGSVDTPRYPGDLESHESEVTPARSHPEPEGAREAPVPSPKDSAQLKAGSDLPATREQTNWEPWKHDAWAQEATRLDGLKKANQTVERDLSQTGQSTSRKRVRHQEARARDKAALERYRLYFEQHERLKRLQQLREQAREAETFREYQPATRRWKPTPPHQKRGYFPWIKGKWAAWRKHRMQGRQRKHEAGNTGGVAGLGTTPWPGPTDKNHAVWSGTWYTRESPEFSYSRHKVSRNGGSDRWRC